MIRVWYSIRHSHYEDFSVKPGRQKSSGSTPTGLSAAADWGGRGIFSINIRQTHFSRNPKLARYLKAYKYVKEFGEGVDRMCREMEADGLLPIKYYKNDFILRAVAWSKNAKDAVSDKVAISSDKVAIKWSEVKERCAPNTIKILEYLIKNGSVSNTVAREITGLSSPGVRKILNNLVENKIVSPEGENKSRVYHLIVEFVFD